MTRQLLLTLGAIKYGAPGTLEKGRKAILESLAKNGIDNTGIIIDNGSGLLSLPLTLPLARYFSLHNGCGLRLQFNHSTNLHPIG